MAFLYEKYFEFTDPRHYKALCKLCKTSIQYSEKSKTNLKQHLEKTHPIVYDEEKNKIMRKNQSRQVLSREGISTTIPTFQKQDGSVINPNADVIDVSSLRTTSKRVR